MALAKRLRSGNGSEGSGASGFGMRRTFRASASSFACRSCRCSCAVTATIRAAWRSVPRSKSASKISFPARRRSMRFRRAVRLNHVRNARAAEVLCGHGRQHVVARVQMRHVELAGAVADRAREAEGQVELPAVGDRVGEVRKDADFDAVGRPFRAAGGARRRCHATSHRAAGAVAHIRCRHRHPMARRGQGVSLRGHDSRDAAIRPRVLEVRSDVEDAEGAHIAKVYYTGPMKGASIGRPWLPYALAAVAALMAALVYLNALDNPFVYDDHRVVLENYSIRDLSNVRALFLNDVFRPVVNISYALDYARSGLRPFGYHLTSLCSTWRTSCCCSPSCAGWRRMPSRAGSPSRRHRPTSLPNRSKAGRRRPQRSSGRRRWTPR